jgi:hypothetical protein
VCVGTRREPQPTPTPAEMADFVASLTRHLQWQREQLRLGKDAQHRFLILRPGERYLVCSPGGMTRLATHNTTLAGCISLSRFVTKHPAWKTEIDGGRYPVCDSDEVLRKRLPRAWFQHCLVKKLDGNKYRGHWDDLASRYIVNYTRSSKNFPGLGNIMNALVSAAATAILSRRILLVENVSSWRHTFDWPLRELVLEGSGFEPYVLRAQYDEDSRLDSYIAEDSSTPDHLCSHALNRVPRQRVWRIFSNQYFTPLLLMNAHHRQELFAMAQQQQQQQAHNAHGITLGATTTPTPRPTLWGPALKLLLRPVSSLTQRADAFYAQHFPNGETVLALHFRCVAFDGVCRFRSRLNAKSAANCARKQLKARGSKHLFVATMHHSHRLAFRTALKGVAKVVWYGSAVEKQEQSMAQEEARLVDLLLLSRADELLLARGSTFSHLARTMALARGKGAHATYFDKCEPFPQETTEPRLHMMDQILKGSAKCREANRSLAQGLENAAAYELAHLRGME